MRVRRRGYGRLARLDARQAATPQGDVLSGFENLVGSATGGSRLTGDAGANRLTGGAGADTLAGGAGADTLIGRWRSTRPTTPLRRAGVTVSLLAGDRAIGRRRAGDILSGIENVIGSATGGTCSSDDGRATRSPAAPAPTL